MEKSHSIQELSARLSDNISHVICGKEEVIQKVVTCLLCAGHILLEDIPGTGKTTLTKALAKSIDGAFTRVQFTPDLLPSDLTGVTIYQQSTGEFTFRRGPVFTNLLLADEINRATPRTQSSLLECMEERQVTVDGVCYPLKPPFFVVATQNPIEIQGTFPLPEAQLDRFFMRLSMGYPPPEEEKRMLSGFRTGNPLDTLKPVTSPEEILSAQQAVREITVSDAVQDYLLRLVSATRSHDRIRLGISPRGALALMRASQAWAGLSGRDYVLPDDVKSVFTDVTAHRILCKGSHFSQSAGDIKALLQELLAETPAPVDSPI